MAMLSFMVAHKSWEDWVGIVLGLLIIFSPAFVGELPGTTVMLVSSMIGILVAALAALETVQLGRWEEILEILSGLALIAAPFVFGYAGEGALQWWHMGLGAIVAILGLAELYQDRNLSADELYQSRK